MFRFEDHMPSYWLDESRDFQLLTRIDDIVFMGLRADISTILNLNDSKKCKNTFLNLLAKKVGFFTDKYIEDKVLRNIIGAFKQAVKHKGTKLGIEYAVTAILKAENSRGVPLIIIDNTINHVIDIYTPVNIKNTQALKEFLKYIVPAGFIVNVYSYVSSPTSKMKFNSIDRLVAASMNIKTLATIRPGQKNYSMPTKDLDRKLEYWDDNNGEHIKRSDLIDYMTKTYAGSINAGIIASIEDLKKAQETYKDQYGQDKFVLEESAKLYKSDSDLDHGIEIEER